jgi:hypothetical protein
VDADPKADPSHPPPCYAIPHRPHAPSPPPRPPPPRRPPILCRSSPPTPQPLSPPPALHPPPPPPTSSSPRPEKWNEKKSVNSYCKML